MSASLVALQAAVLLQLLLLLSIAITIASANAGGGGGAFEAPSFHHQAPDQHKLSQGWQEPGLWRPKWIMDRTFEDPNGGPIKQDRIYFKLKSDRTMKIVNSKSRPLLEMFKPRVGDAEKKKKKLFETAEEAAEKQAQQDEERSGSRESRIKRRAAADAAAAAAEEAMFNVDGTWWWQDASPLNGGRVKLETREGPQKQERISHDGFCEWGTLDGYAAKFKVGRIMQSRMTEAGVPLGAYQAGTFTLRVSPHRPLVGKDFLAFE